MGLNQNQWLNQRLVEEHKTNVCHKEGKQGGQNDDTSLEERISTRLNCEAREDSKCTKAVLQH